MGIMKKLKKRARKALKAVKNVTRVGAKIADTVGPLGSAAPPPFGTLVAAGSQALKSADAMVTQTSKLIGKSTNAEGKVDSIINNNTITLPSGKVVVKSGKGKSFIDDIFGMFGM